MIIDIFLPIILISLLIGFGLLMVKLIKSKINIFIKLLLVFLGFFIIGIIFFTMIIIRSWIADPAEMEKAVSLAEEYILETNRKNVELNGGYYDDGGVYPFEYAANAKNTQDHTEFFIYFDVDSKKIVDNYVSKRWEKELRGNIEGYVKQKLGKINQFYLWFDDTVGSDYDVDPNQQSSYKDFEATASIDIYIPRKKKGEDIKIFNEILSHLKDEAKLKHVKLTISYFDVSPLEDEIWEGSY